MTSAVVGEQCQTEALAGLVERVTFHNAENGFCVLRVKVRGQRDLVTVVGHAAMISAGEFVQMSGRWFNDHTHGLQFKAEFLKASPPTTVEGIERYLGSGMIRGIGPVYAKKLVKAFGEAVFDLIEQEPHRLREVTGIGPKRAERIVGGWADQKVIREIMLFLHSNGVGTSRAVRIFKTYGQDAVRLISENPYRLAKDIRGIGFKTADQIARKMGIAPDAMIRVRAGISYALGEAMDEGHCGLPVGELLTSTAELLEVAAPLIETALALELEAGDVVADSVGETSCIFLAGLYRAEQSIAERLRACAVGRPPWPEIDAEKAMTWVEGKTGLAMAPSQQEAVRLALRSKVLVITGDIEEERRLLYVAMTRAKDSLDIMVPQRFYVHGQHSRGDRHVYASRTRFIDRDMLSLFEAVSWPVVKPEDQARQEAVKSVRIDMAARLRGMWS